MSADSVVPDPFNGQSFNRYSYVDNGPLSATDPTGHVGCEAQHCEQWYDPPPPPPGCGDSSIECVPVDGRRDTPSFSFSLDGAFVGLGVPALNIAGGGGNGSGTTIETIVVTAKKYVPPPPVIMLATVGPDLSNMLDVPNNDPKKFDWNKYNKCLADNSNALWYADNIGLWSAGTSIGGFAMNAGGAAGWWGLEKGVDKAGANATLDFLQARQGVSSYFAYENFSKLVTVQNGMKVLGKVGLGVTVAATAASAGIRGYCALQASD